MRTSSVFLALAGAIVLLGVGGMFALRSGMAKGGSAGKEATPEPSTPDHLNGAELREGNHGIVDDPYFDRDPPVLAGAKDRVGLIRTLSIDVLGAAKSAICDGVMGTLEIEWRPGAEVLRKQVELGRTLPPVSVPSGAKHAQISLHSSFMTEVVTQREILGERDAYVAIPVEVGGALRVKVSQGLCDAGAIEYIGVQRRDPTDWQSAEVIDGIATLANMPVGLYEIFIDCGVPGHKHTQDAWIAACRESSVDFPAVEAAKRIVSGRIEVAGRSASNVAVEVIPFGSVGQGCGIVNSDENGYFEARVPYSRRYEVWVHSGPPGDGGMVYGFLSTDPGDDVAVFALPSSTAKFRIDTRIALHPSSVMRLEIAPVRLYSDCILRQSAVLALDQNATVEVSGLPDGEYVVTAFCSDGSLGSTFFTMAQQAFLVSSAPLGSSPVVQLALPPIERTDLQFLDGSPDGSSGFIYARDRSCVAAPFAFAFFFSGVSLRADLPSSGLAWYGVSASRLFVSGPDKARDYSISATELEPVSWTKVSAVCLDAQSGLPVDAMWTLFSVAGENWTMPPQAGLKRFVELGPIPPGRYVLSATVVGGKHIARAIELVAGMNFRGQFVVDI